MQFTHSLGLALFLALFPLGAPQGEKKTDPAKPAKPLTAAQSDAQRIREDLLGAWQLVRANTLGEDFSGSACRGVMLVIEGYMSMNVQLDSKTAPVRWSSGELFSSAAYRWAYDGDRLMLATSTLLGVDNFTPDDMVKYESAGVRRVYRVDLAGDALTLDREGGGSLTFTRMSPPRGEEPTTKKEPPAKK